MSVMNREELARMKTQELKDVDESTLVDIKKINVDRDLPVNERVIQFIAQVRNPYCFKVEDTVVKLRFTENGSSCQEAFCSMAQAMRMGQ